MATATMEKPATTAVAAPVEPAKAPKPKERNKPTGPLGVVYTDKATAELPENVVRSGKKGGQNQYTLWESQREGKPSVWAYGKTAMEAAYYCHLANLIRTYQVAGEGEVTNINGRGTVVEATKARPILFVRRADGKQRGKVATLKYEHLAILRKVIAMVDAKQFGDKQRLGLESMKLLDLNRAADGTPILNGSGELQVTGGLFAPYIRTDNRLPVPDIAEPDPLKKFDELCA